MFSGASHRYILCTGFHTMTAPLDIKLARAESGADQVQLHARCTVHCVGNDQMQPWTLYSVVHMDTQIELRPCFPA